MSGAEEAPAGALVRVTLKRAPDKADVEAPDAADVRVAKAQSPGPTLGYLGLFRYASRREKLMALGGVLAAVVGGAMVPVFTIFLGNLFNALGNPGVDLMDEVRRNVVKIVYLGLAAFASGYVEITLCTLSGRSLASGVRGRFLESVLKQDAAWHETGGAMGTVIRGLNEDTASYQDAVGDRLGNFCRNVSTTVTALIVSFVRGWELTAVMTATMPALMAVSIACSVASKKLQDLVMEATSRANGIVQQALMFIRTVASYGMEPSVVAKYDAELDAPEAAGIRQGALSALVVASTNSVFFCTIALATWYGSLRVADGTYTGGEVLSILMASMLGGFALGQTMPHLKHFSVGIASAQQLFSVIARKPAIDEEAPGEQLAEVRGDIELEGVVFAYPARPERRIFDNFSLTIAAGTTVALVGESGSGKSTIIQLVERFYDPAAGQVLLDGHNIKGLQLRWLRSQMALVSQEPTLFSTSIFENIANSRPGVTRDEVIAAATAANAHEFISKLPEGYDTHVGERGGQLSGGQRQRIAIARALLRNPKILLLDEATSALDAQSERAVQDALNNVMGGRTTVVIAHRLSTIIDADNIAVVRSGKVVEQGAHKVLMQMKGGFYRGLVARQQLVAEADESGLRSQFGDSGDKSLATTQGPATSQPKKKKPVLRDSVMKRTSVRLSVIPTDIADRLQELRSIVSPNSGTRALVARLFALNRPEWGYALAGVLASLALGAEMPGFALALSGITTTYYQPDPEDIKAGGSKWGLIFVGIAIATLLVTTFQGWCFGVMGQRLARRARIMLLRAVLRQDMGWFDAPENSSGEVMSRLSADVAALKGAVGDALGTLTHNLAMLVIGVALSFWACWSMTLVGLAALPFLVAAYMVAAAQAFGHFDSNSEGTAAANQVATEAVAAIKVVTAYSLQPQVATLYHQAAAEGGGSRSAHFSGLAFGVAQLILFLFYCLMFWFGGTQIQAGAITFTQMNKSYNILLYVAMGLATAGAKFPEIIKAGPAARRVFALIDRKPAIDMARPGAEVDISGDVELRNVTFAYPARPGRLIFKYFNLQVPAGTSCALVGESGHGKSTIIGLLERFYAPVDGTVLVDGIDISNLSVKHLRSQIGLVGQEPVMFSATIMENIRIGNPHATMSQVVDAARIANALGFIEGLPEGYDTRLGEGGMQLSGGQKQRIAIARAVLRNPRILMLDEATAALDAESEKLVQDALDAAMAGRTTFVVAHRLSTVVNCTKIAAIYRGRVLEEGSHAELMRKNGYYAYLVAASST